MGQRKKLFRNALNHQVVKPEGKIPFGTIENIKPEIKGEGYEIVH